MTAPERCQCGHFPVMHAGGNGPCNHGSHNPKKGETGCDCSGFRSQTLTMSDTNDTRFATQAPAAQPSLLGVVNDASEDYEA